MHDKLTAFWLVEQSTIKWIIKAVATMLTIKFKMAANGMESFHIANDVWSTMN